MTHALKRTNATGQPFIGRCIKFGQADLRMSEALNSCPADDVMSDESALLEVLRKPNTEGE